MANAVTLIGNLVRDVELLETSSGTNVAKFTLAVKRQGKDAETDFIDIVAFGTTGELCNKYLSKGKKAYVQGRLQINKYEDKEGNKRTSASVVANEVEFLTPKGETEEKPKVKEVKVDDDLPF